MHGSTRWLWENPDIHYGDASRRGYTVLDITPAETRVADRDRPGIQD